MPNYSDVLECYLIPMPAEEGFVSNLRAKLNKKVISSMGNIVDKLYIVYFKNDNSSISQKDKAIAIINYLVDNMRSMVNNSKIDNKLKKSILKELNHNFNLYKKSSALSDIFIKLDKIMQMNLLLTKTNDDLKFSLKDDLEKNKIDYEYMKIFDPNYDQQQQIQMMNFMMQQQMFMQQQQLFQQQINQQMIQQATNFAMNQSIGASMGMPGTMFF